jgi:hypothetical protein
MSASGFELSNLQDARLALLATSQLPAWLWSVDATRIVWANPIGAAIFGASTSSAISARKFDAVNSTAAQVVRLATTLVRDAPPRLERLRGFGAELGGSLTCACSHITLRGSHEPVAVYSAAGQLLCATQSAHSHLGGATSLAALGAHALASTALAGGHAAGNVGDHRVSIDRLGGETATVLVVNFAANEAAAVSVELLPPESAQQGSAAGAAEPALPATPSAAGAAGGAAEPSEGPP